MSEDLNANFQLKIVYVLNGPSFFSSSLLFPTFLGVSTDQL